MVELQARVVNAGAYSTPEGSKDPNNGVFLGPNYCILMVFGISNPTIWVHGPLGTLFSSAGHGQPAALPGQDVWGVSWHPV